MVERFTEAEQMLAAGYVLEELSDEEAQDFEQRLKENPALIEEVKALQIALGSISQELPQVTPPPGLRDRILTAYLEQEVPQQQRRQLPWTQLLAGITVLLALLLGFDNWRLRNALSIARQEQPESGSVASIMQRPKSRLVALKGEGNSSATGSILFTPGKWEEVIVSLADLPPLPPEQVYRMWLSLANGQIIPCGEFKTNDRGTVFIKLSTPQSPPQGVKAKGVFVTADRITAPLKPSSQPIMSAEL